MVGDQGEVPSHQVVSQFLDSPLYCEGFSFHCVVLPFGGCELTYRTECSLLLKFWDRMAPSPASEASVCTVNGREKSGFLKTGELVRACLRACNAHFSSSVHYTWLIWSLLVKSERGTLEKRT